MSPVAVDMSSRLSRRLASVCTGPRLDKPRSRSAAPFLAISLVPADLVLHRILLLQLDADPRPGQIRPYRAVPRLRGAIEQHVFNADMIMKPLEVTQAANGASGMQGHGRGAMPGKVNMVGL